MISSRQIRAARGLLGWSQSQLAEATSLHLNAISNIEAERGHPRVDTITRIQTALELAGVQFRGQRGVEIKEDIFLVTRFEGPDYTRRLAEDTLSHMRGPDDEVLNCYVDEQFFESANKKMNDIYYRHMKKTGFRERNLMSIKTKEFINPDKKAYRWLPENVLGTIAYTVHANRVAFIKWETQEVLMIKNQSLANTFRGQFEYLWSQAKPFK